MSLFELGAFRCPTCPGPTWSTCPGSPPSHWLMQVRTTDNLKIIFCLLKGTVAWDFGPVFWPVWTDLGLNMNHFWFLSFKEAPLIWYRHFKFWCVSCQTFSEILRISEKDRQLNPLMLWKNILGEPRTQLPILLWELGTRLPILLRDSKNLR
jgi:hypothetical protein